MLNESLILCGNNSMYKNKEDVLKDFHELEITDFGDFKIKEG